MGVKGWSFSPPGGLLNSEVAAVERWVCSEGVDHSFWVKSSDFVGTVAGFVPFVEVSGLVSEQDARCGGQGSEVRVTRALPSVRSGTIVPLKSL